MDPIVKEFEDDLNKILIQIELLEMLGEFIGHDTSLLEDDSSHFLTSAIELLTKIKESHTNLPIARGTLILYTCGRFESMVRTMFEDLCQRLVAAAKVYQRLPTRMQENLPLFTARVISEPRKYGHAEGGVRTFVSTLAQNLQPNAHIDTVNYQCLSITDSNMRADVLSDLFGRVGANEIWKLIAQQASIKIYFKDNDVSAVESKSKRKLNDLMDLRNKIAHPSGSIDWPSPDSIKDNLNYLKILTKVLGELMGIYENTLCKPA
ncbi:HEPN domain-containing protein [Shewanella putrefaciens]|uniref:HEPN domain-containing protein n=1 Tax=Shewanella putrefaciens TaxID=24 RepID=UPI0018E7EC88|nr:HEPN domain-containing protein [Shewanella putrefaciens]